MGFKQRPKKEKAAARKRTREADDDVTEADEQTLQTIEELLEDQKLRAKLRTLEGGDSGSKSAKQAKRGDTAAAATDAQYGLHDPKKDGGTNQKLMKLLDGQFTGQTSTSEKDQHEELMYGLQHACCWH